jgi:Aerotolerance regulator N-terminal
MTFLYPVFLWAFLVLTIPVVIHLFNFRKTQKIYFSNTRFIQQVKEATSAKRKLKHWLVLASRLLFLFFLVLVFAQPIVPATNQLQAGESVGIYIDNSLSMSTPTDGNARALDAALQVARELIEKFPSDLRYRLLTNDFLPFSNSLKTQKEALDILAQLRTSGQSRSSEEIQTRFSRLGNERTIFWISDFQQSTFGAPKRSDSLHQWNLLPISLTNTSNIFVDTAYLTNPFAIVGERNTLTFRLFNEGATARDALTTKLVVNDVQLGTASVALPANGYAEVSFDLSTATNANSRVEFSFTDAPVTFDNNFFSVLSYSDPISVTEIKTSASAKAIEKVFANTAIFKFSSLLNKNIDYSIVENSDLVVLNELPQIDDSFLNILRNYLQQGGTVLLIPAASGDVASYRKIYASITASPQQQLTVLAKPDFGNPFYANVFQEKSAQIAMPSVRNSIEWGVDRQALLTQQDGRPFLSKVQGNLYLLGSALQAEYGSFSNHALFLPVMYRIAAISQRKQDQLYYLLTERQININTDSLPSNSILSLSGSVEVTPSQRSLNKQTMLDLAGLELQPDFYVARVGTDTLTWLALNQTKHESRLSTLSEDELLSAFEGNALVYDINTQTFASSNITDSYQGKALWKYMLILSLLFLATEMLLLRFWK